MMTHYNFTINNSDDFYEETSVLTHESGSLIKKFQSLDSSIYELEMDDIKEYAKRFPEGMGNL